MWISINILLYYIKDTNTVTIIGIGIWVILSIIFYFTSKYFLQKIVQEKYYRKNKKNFKIENLYLQNKCKYKSLI